MPQYKGTYGIWQYTSTWSIGGKDFDGNWAYKDYPSIVKAMTGEKTPEKEEDGMTAEEVKKDRPGGHPGVCGRTGQKGYP